MNAIRSVVRASDVTGSRSSGGHSSGMSSKGTMCPPIAADSPRSIARLFFRTGCIRCLPTSRRRSTLRSGKRHTRTGRRDAAEREDRRVLRTCDVSRCTARVPDRQRRGDLCGVQLRADEGFTTKPQRGTKYTEFVYFVLLCGFVALWLCGDPPWGGWPTLSRRRCCASAPLRAASDRGSSCGCGSTPASPRRARRR